MSQKHRRYPLKSKDSKQVFAQTSDKLKINVEEKVGSKALVEVVESEFGELLLIEGKPLLFKVGGMVFPTLMADSLLTGISKVVVDMGAVRFVCNGADVMAPGIVRYEGSFSKGDIVLVVDVKHGKPLALGEILYTSEEVKAIKQGPVVKSRHYVSDKIWNLAKAYAE
jgi:PUA-domain protein